jgi:hypothetical protein
LEGPAVQLSFNTPLTENDLRSCWFPIAGSDKAVAVRDRKIENEEVDVSSQ